MRNFTLTPGDILTYCHEEYDHHPYAEGSSLAVAKWTKDKTINWLFRPSIIDDIAAKCEYESMTFFGETKLYTATEYSLEVIRRADPKRIIILDLPTHKKWYGIEFGYFDIGLSQFDESWYEAKIVTSDSDLERAIKELEIPLIQYNPFDNYAFQLQ